MNFPTLSLHHFPMFYVPFKLFFTRSMSGHYPINLIAKNVSYSNKRSLSIPYTLFFFAVVAQSIY
jgi:hypothetical protein